MIFKRGAGYLVTLVERKTRFLTVELVDNKKSDTVRSAIEASFRHFPQAVKSIAFAKKHRVRTTSIISKKLKC